MAVFKKENRRRRHTTKSEAWLMLEGGFAKRSCTVLDLSAGGARIKLAEAGPIANRLSLALTKDARKATRCRVVWSKESVVGLEFI